MKNHHHNANIGIFDSGVGGLSVLLAIQSELPKANYIYCSDNKNYPYGPKSEEEVIRYAKETTKRLIDEFEIDILVVACNTASTVALDSLRKEYSLPIVGVVPAVKPAAESSKTKKIAVLATPGTIKRAYTQKLIDEFASGCRVVKLGSSFLVSYAEDKLREHPLDSDKLAVELKPLTSEKELDTVVLACTHFPLIKEEISKCFKGNVNFVDSGAAIANRVVSLLNEMDFEYSEKPRKNHAVFTKNSTDISELENYLMDHYGFDHVSFIGEPSC